MKKLFLSLFAFALVFALGACNPDERDARTASEEIRFAVAGDGLEFSVDTRAAAVTSVSSVYWEALSGASVIYPVAEYSVSAGSVATGRYWPVESTTYNYRVSNVSFATSSGVISAANTTDIVVGTASASNNSCTVELNHIFARTGSLSLSAPSGFSISDVSWKIASNGSAAGTAGTYTIGGGWASSGATALSKQAFTSASDLYLIPGSYNIEVTYTLSSGAFSKTYVKSADVSLVQGKVNNISSTAPVPDDANPISFSVTVTAWGTENLNPVFE